MKGGSGEWSTPKWLFDQWDKKHHFTLDACATAANTKCERFFDKKQDALFRRWDGTVWMNPPYGRNIIEWVRKAHYTYLRDHTVVCLLPASTDTKWFHEYCLRGKVTFLRGRVKFGGSNKTAPFPSMIVEFLPKNDLIKGGKHA